MLYELQKQNVVNIFCTMAQVSEAEAQQYDSIINVSMHEVGLMLKDDAEIGGNADIIEYLCAAIAYYKYALIISSNNPQSFKAQDIAINCNNKAVIENAFCVRDNALTLAASFICDNSFCFKQM